MYQTTAPTYSTNRICSAVRAACDGTTNYQTTAPNPTTNRVCSPLTTCDGTSNYQTTAPSTTSNRACSALTVCDGVNFYQVTAPSTTSNRVCGIVAVCDGTTNYQTTAPNPTTNRVCSSVAVCDGTTTYQTTPPTITSNRVCSAVLAPCSAIQYEAAAPTITSNRVCASCLASQYVNSPTSCAYIRNCTSTEYESVAPTKSSNRECKTVTICTPGQYLATPASAISDAVCQGCPAGYFCAGALTSMQPCGSANKFSAGNANQCTDVSTGFYSIGGAQDTLRTGQLACSIGFSCSSGIRTSCVATQTFQDQTTQTSCKSCLVCATGLTMTSECTPASNRVCMDLTPPVLTLTAPTSLTLEAVTDSYTEPGYTASDTYDGVLTSAVTFTAAPNMRVPKTYTITYSVQDAAGLLTLATRTIVVRDTTAPVLQLLGKPSFIVEAGDSYTDAGASATDLVDGNISSSVTTIGLDALLSAVFGRELGVFTLQFAVSDNAGNVAPSVYRQVSIVDTLEPVITLKGESEVRLEATKVRVPYVDAGATATDKRDGDVSSSIVASGISRVDTTKPGTYIITYNVADAVGLAAAEVTRRVVVADRTPPVINIIGSTYLKVEGASVYQDLGAIVSDGYDDNTALTNSLVIRNPVDTKAPAGSKFTITYDVVDSSGNVALTVQRSVEIIDTTPPTITITGFTSVVVEATSTYTDLGATAVDLLDGSLEVVVTNPVDTRPAQTPATYQVGYVATDAAGNKATTFRTVRVVDTLPPVVTVDGSMSMRVEAATDFVDPFATAVDALDGNVEVEVRGTVNMMPSFTPTTYRLTYISRDAAGNVGVSPDRLVTVVDTTSPVITLKGSALNTVEGGLSYVDPGYTAFDSLEGSLTSEVVVTITRTRFLGGGQQSTEPVTSIDSNIAAGTYFTITYKVVDDAGNDADAKTRKVTVIDTRKPVLTLTAPQNDFLEASNPPIAYTLVGATAWDSLDGDITPNIAVTVAYAGQYNLQGLGSVDSSASLGTIFALELSVTDAAGNAAAKITRALELRDTTGPVLALNVYPYVDGRSIDPELTSGAYVILYVGETYLEPSATVTDAYEGNVDSFLLVSGDVIDTSVANVEFMVRYDAQDSRGNQATPIFRKVRVDELPSSSASQLPAVAAGATVSVVLVIVLIVVLFFFLVVRRARSAKGRQEKEDKDALAEPLTKVSDSNEHNYEAVDVRVYDDVDVRQRPPAAAPGVEANYDTLYEQRQRVQEVLASVLRAHPQGPSAEESDDDEPPQMMAKSLGFPANPLYDSGNDFIPPAQDVYDSGVQFMRNTTEPAPQSDAQPTYDSGLSFAAPTESRQPYGVPRPLVMQPESQPTYDSGLNFASGAQSGYIDVDLKIAQPVTESYLDVQISAPAKPMTESYLDVELAPAKPVTESYLDVELSAPPKPVEPVYDMAVLASAPVPAASVNHYDMAAPSFGFEPEVLEHIPIAVASNEAYNRIESGPKAVQVAPESHMYNRRQGSDNNSEVIRNVDTEGYSLMKPPTEAAKPKAHQYEEVALPDESPAAYASIAEPASLAPQTHEYASLDITAKPAPKAAHDYANFKPVVPAHSYVNIAQDFATFPEPAAAPAPAINPENYEDVVLAAPALPAKKTPYTLVATSVEASSSMGLVAGRPRDQWMHGSIDRAEAEQRLRQSGQSSGLFLVRCKSEAEGSYALTVLVNDQFFHRLIESGSMPGTYSIDRKRVLAADSLEQAIDSLVSEACKQHNLLFAAPLPSPSYRPTKADAMLPGSDKTGRYALVEFGFGEDATAAAYLHGPIDRPVAETRLRSAGMADGLFLVRDSSNGAVVISLACRSKVYHFKFDATATGFKHATGRTFNDVAAIVAFYSEGKRDDLPVALAAPCPLPTSAAQDDDQA